MTDNTEIKDNIAIDDKENDEDKSFWDKYKYRIILLFIGILVVYVLFWYFTYDHFYKWEKRGQFGDMFGAVNALYSGLALAGIIITLLLQSQELRLQRKELRLTREQNEDNRKELEGQKKIMATQIKLMEHQQWENTFFKMVDMHRNNVEQFRLGNYSGYDTFIKVEKELKDNIERYNENKSERDRSQSQIKENTMNRINTINDSLRHYISTVITILEYILDLEDTTLQPKYFKIFKSQIAKGEAGILLLYREHFEEETEFQKVMDATNFLHLLT